MTPAGHPDVIVLGTGTMGASTCLALARRGTRVIGFDRFTAPNDQGAHHGESRMFRMSYFEHPDYVPLLQRSLELWRELGRDTGAELFHLTGGLYPGPEDGALVGGSLASARQHGLAHEVLVPAAIERRFPQFRIEPGWAGVLERDAGFVLPELAVSAFVNEARRLGAEIREREGVREWFADAGGVAVVTARGTYRAATLVICPGPWSAKVIADLGVPLTISRQVMGWVRPEKPAWFAPDRFPVWAIERDATSIYYGFPVMPGTRLLKISVHGPGPQTDPDHVNRTGSDADEAWWRAGLERYLPSARGPSVRQVICMYDNSPDGHFILDRHPRHERVMIACGFSGHGFKFAPVVGEALADLCCEGGTRLPIGFLNLGRFRGGRP